uniref:Uncharacterized protein n=1 Tax=Astyanax mexicanus TaxID=7994 RepID=A0A3B1INJ4_ASTMX
MCVCMRVCMRVCTLRTNANPRWQVCLEIGGRRRCRKSFHLFPSLLPALLFTNALVLQFTPVRYETLHTGPKAHL